MNTRPHLHERRYLFQAHLPANLKQSLRVVDCSQKNWNVLIPGSKSVTNRALVLAAMSARPIEIQAPLLADDTWWGFLALDQLGFELSLSHLPESALIRPPKYTRLNRTSDPHSVLIHVGQAGTLGRFLPAALLNWQTVYPDSPLRRFVMTADDQLARRPLTPLLSALTELGAVFEFETKGESFPLSLSVSQLNGSCSVDSSTSGQFLSGVLLAAAGSARTCRITRPRELVQPDYVRMTLGMLNDFGARIDVDNELRNFTVYGQALTSPSVYRVEADASTACYYAGLACVLGVELEVANIGSTTIQPDFEFVSILQKFGFHVLVKSDSFRVYGSRPRSNVLVPLKLDMSRCSDQALTVGVMSIITGIPVEVRGVAHIRHHESDRIASFCRNCRSLGIEVDEFPDGFVVRAGIDARLLAGEWPTHNDHRFALSGIVLSAWAHGVRVLNPACMQKTAPSFVKHLQTLGVNFES